MFPPISYLPDPKDPTVLWPQDDPHYSGIQQFYNNLGQYRTLDAKAATAAETSWKQWAVGAVIANNAKQFGSYRPAPVAPDGHVVTFNGVNGVITDSGKPVWTPDPTWNVNEWQTSQTGTGEDLVKVNDPAAKLQNAGGFAGVGVGAPQAVSLNPAQMALLQQLLAFLGKA